MAAVRNAGSLFVSLRRFQYAVLGRHLDCLQYVILVGRFRHRIPGWRFQNPILWRRSKYMYRERRLRTRIENSRIVFWEGKLRTVHWIRRPRITFGKRWLIIRINNDDQKSRIRNSQSTFLISSSPSAFPICNSRSAFLLRILDRRWSTMQFFVDVFNTQFLVTVFNMDSWLAFWIRNYQSACSIYLLRTPTEDCVLRARTEDTCTR